MNNKIIAHLMPGSIMGEMALLNEEHKRHADVLSITDVKLLLIPRNMLSFYERQNPRTANKLLHVLCNNLSTKLASINEILQKTPKK